MPKTSDLRPITNVHNIKPKGKKKYTIPTVVLLKVLEAIYVNTFKNILKAILPLRNIIYLIFCFLRFFFIEEQSFITRLQYIWGTEFIRKMVRFH